MKILIRILFTIIYSIFYIVALPVQLLCAFIHSVSCWAYSSKITFKEAFKEACETWFCFQIPTKLLKDDENLFRW